MSEDFIKGLYFGAGITGMLICAYFDVKEKQGKVTREDIGHILFLAVFLYSIPVGCVVYAVVAVIAFLGMAIEYLWNICV